MSWVPRKPSVSRLPISPSSFLVQVGLPRFWTRTFPDETNEKKTKESANRPGMARCSPWWKKYVKSIVLFGTEMEFRGRWHVSLIRSPSVSKVFSCTMCFVDREIDRNKHDRQRIYEWDRLKSMVFENITLTSICNSSGRNFKL